jgi:hypothetical protein
MRDYPSDTKLRLTKEREMSTQPATPAAAQTVEQKAAALGMPVWMYLLYAPYLPPQKNAEWTPTFFPQQYITQPGAKEPQALSIYDFPTLETAQHLQDKYAPGGHVQSLIYTGVGGVESSPSGSLPFAYAITLKNGSVMYASALAAIWAQNPGHPDAADNICQQFVDAVRGR